MADNTQLNSGSGGNVIRTLEDGSSVHWPVGVVAYATSTGTPDVLTIPTAAALADNTSNPTTLLTGACLLVFDGSTWDRAPGTSADGILVNLGSNNDVTVTGTVAISGTVTVGSHEVTNAGTFAVQATSVVPGTGATNLGKAIDSAQGSTDTGVACLAVRDDSIAALTPAEGDYVPLLVNGSGALWVKETSNNYTGGRLMVHTSYEVVEDDAHSNNQTAIFPVTVRKDTAASTAGTDGDYAAFTTDASGRLWASAVQSGTWNIGTVTAVTAISNALPAGTNNIGDVDVLSIAAGDNNIGNVDIVTVPSDPFGANADAASATGSISAKLRFMASTGIPITGTVTIAGAVTNAGTFAVQESGGALTALQIMDDWDNAASDGASVSGDTAHDAADAGEPVKQGFKATSALSGLTLVANNDRTDGFAGLDGVQITRPHTNLEDLVDGNASNTDGSSTQVIAAAGAGIKQYLCVATLTNTSSSNIYVELKSGTTVKWTVPLPANGGAHLVFNPPLKPNAANEAWNFDPSAATSTVYCSLLGFKSKV